MKPRKYILVFFIGFFLLAIFSYGQKQKDSLSVINDINTLNFNYSQSINKNPLKSLSYAKEAFSFFEETESNALKFKVATNYITALFINGRYKDALLILNDIEFLEVEEKSKALYFTLRGLVENDLNYISQAEESYKKALKLYIKLKDKDNEFTILNNLGLLYNNIGDYKRSLELYLNCYDIINDLKVKVDRYKYYMNIGTVSYNLNDYNDAIESFTNALNEATNNNNTFRVFRAQEKMAQTHVDLNKLDIAIEHYNDALLGYRQLGLKKEECTMLLHLGDIHYLKNDKNIAFNNYSKAQQIASKYAFLQEGYRASLNLAIYYKEQSKFNEARLFYRKVINNESHIVNLNVLKDAYKGLYEIEKQNRNTLLSLAYLESYLKYDNDIKEIQLITQKEQTQVQYSLKQKERDLEKLEIDFALNDLKLKNKQQQFQGLIILSALILLVLILILRSYIQNKKAQKLLSQRNEKINSQNEKLVLINKEIKAQRKELHGLNKIKDQLLSIIAHDVKSPMTDLYNLLFILRHNLNTIHKDELKKNLAVIESSTSNLLNLLNNLLNWTISQSSGVKVKKSNLSLIDLINTNLKLIESSIVAKELVVNFSPDVKLNFIKSDLNIVDFALRNILSNAVKFTNKKGTINVEIIKSLNGLTEIKIADSGIGFNEDIHNLLIKNTERVPAALGTNAEKGYGIGLSLCKKMLAEIDSQIIYEKNEPSGSIFILQLNPLN
ncbi:tetratricopeptide repeat-containing sensor histidine kinase [Flavivirga spongiicola]|uniref:histidine kinase n=1 Tax=Flavivirga spongiicola TaxID=421621 RepID=A0ABU7XSJ6_9FLAO|nr:tetratricopeptide repeat-containing sensor histidine kinase [Flavivirga sp. MEBiC05379]MDO5977822.1 tetratricopeptide repeat-containing sensor histidine kinase [Flavivirga sp. MEBiC05379]